MLGLGWLKGIKKRDAAIVAGYIAEKGGARHGLRLSAACCRCLHALPYTQMHLHKKAYPKTGRPDG
ncbi:hypothetical protein HYN48_09540 [Flavobacterium magnum]|uniref:Uncharacterized protein n=1 Tax=Flavobacterium magnum TaxID=2162713 RepID=A0A2S0RED2_9FLAO|nr:hypothetical protein HYN48_09540 [Flavobacterium magnum]